MHIISNSRSLRRWDARSAMSSRCLYVVITTMNCIHMEMKRHGGQTCKLPLSKRQTSSGRQVRSTAPSDPKMIFRKLRMDLPEGPLNHERSSQYPTRSAKQSGAREIRCDYQLSNIASRRASRRLRSPSWHDRMRNRAAIWNRMAMDHGPG